MRGGEVWTFTGQYCMNGITRGTIIKVGRAAGIPVYERVFSLTDVYGADEAFVTGTLGGVTPVVEVDGRVIGGGQTGPVTKRLSQRYKETKKA